MQKVKIFNQFDSPWDFKLSYQIEQWKLEYKNLIEINQGSPLVGNLYLNGKELSRNTLFGSPFIYINNYIYIPMFIRRFCLSGFILNKIDLTTSEIFSIGKIKNLIYLDCIEDNILTYYTDIDRTKKEKVDISKDDKKR